MERGNPLPDGERQPRIIARKAAPSWRDAIRRGAILGGVVGAHVVLLMLVLHPWWRRLTPAARQRDASVLRLSFDRLPKPAAGVRAAAALPLPIRTKAARQPIVLPTPSPTLAAATHPRTAPAANWITTVPPVAADPDGGYQTGDFQAALQGAQRTRPDHLPGSVTPLIGGIQLHARSSTKAIVRGLIEENRCANMQFQLQDSAHQLTPTMIDHVLEVEGCGPHRERTPLDATIDAITRQATAGH